VVPVGFGLGHTKTEVRGGRRHVARIASRTSVSAVVRKWRGRVRPFTVSMAIVATGLMVTVATGCSMKSGGTSSPTGAEMAACAVIDNLFSGRAATQADGQRVIGYSKSSGDPQLAQDAAALVNAANAANQAGVNHEIVKMADRCHTGWHIGPGDQ
jgi:hypothetical protein